MSWLRVPESNRHYTHPFEWTGARRKMCSRFARSILWTQGGLAIHKHENGRRGFAPRRVIPMAIATPPTTCVTLLTQLRRDPSDPAGWDEFVERYGRHIYRWCRQWKLQDADAEDVTQDILVKLT